MLTGLKIDIHSLAAVHEVLPRLLELLAEYQVQASFFPALGPDPARRGGRLARLLSPPDIAAAGAEALRRIVAGGHEIGATAYDVAAWQDQVLERDAAWTREQMQRGAAACRTLFGSAPAGYAAPGFLVNADTPRLEQELGFDYAVDSRGFGVYYPAGAAGVSRCPQVAVSLPTLESAMAAGQGLDEVHQYLFMETQKPVLPGHVFCFTAADPNLLPVLERLLVMWMGSQRKVVPLTALLREGGPWPCHELGLLRLGDGRRFAAQGARVAER